jgi:hypothetical protein
MAALTTAIYPYHYLPHISWSGGPNAVTLSELHPIACGMLIVRNALLVGVVAWSGARVFTQRTAPASRQGLMAGEISAQ